MSNILGVSGATDYYIRMHPALMSDALDDLNTPDFTVVCPAPMFAFLEPLLRAMTDIGNLRNYIYALETIDAHEGPIVLLGASTPVGIVRAAFEGLGYSVKLSQVTA